MKKIIFSLLAIGTSAAMFAQALVSTSPKGRNVVLEEFTGIKCGYCPDGHKIAESINSKNPGRVVLINIHEGGYAVPSTGQPDFRTPYGTAISQMCQVSGYPSGTVNRVAYPSSTSVLGMGRGSWEAAAAAILSSGNSPVNVGVSSTFNSTNNQLEIQVELYYTGDGAGTNKVNVVLLENHVFGYQASGGSNYDHKHIMRDMITGQWGEDVTTTTPGTKFSKTYTYNFDVNKYNIDNCDIAVYVTKSDNKTIYTGEQVIAKNGKTIAPNGALSLPTAVVQSAAASTKSFFSFNTSNNGATAEDFKFDLTGSSPAGWVADFEINGNAYGTTATLNMTAGANLPAKINVTPNSTAGIGTYTLTMTSITNPSSPAVVMSVNVIAGVTDLIISNSAKDGNGTNDATKFENVFTTALAAAGNTTYAATNTIFATSAMKDNALAGVKNIYYNVGWTFPTYPNDDFVNSLTSFLNGGGCFFISGQDIAWDMFSGHQAANGTAAQKAFSTNYLNFKFYNDGSTSKNSASVNTGDIVFGNLNTGGNIAITDYYGGGALFPDVMGAVGSGQGILFHGGISDSLCGVRTQGSNYKTVVVSFGMEQVNATVANAVIGRSHDWFYGLVSTADFDKSMTYALGQNFPNPSSDITIIPLSGIDKELTLQIMDISGRILNQQTISKAATEVKINTSALESGYYLYRLLDEGNVSKALPMQVIH